MAFSSGLRLFDDHPHPVTPAAGFSGLDFLKKFHFFCPGLK
jgi:hypothetical protein